MDCPRCGGADVVRGGWLLLREFREIIAPQKYRCSQCDCRWLDWPRLYRGDGPLSAALRRLRGKVAGRGEWELPRAPAPGSPGSKPS